MNLKKEDGVDMECKKCNSEMVATKNVVFLSCPPKIKFRCKKCGFVDHHDKDRVK